MTTQTPQSAGPTQPTQTQTQTPVQPEVAAPDALSLTWEDWLGEQGEDVRTLYNQHAQGLSTALKSERDARKGLEKELRDMAGKSAAGSEAQAQLTQMADSLGEADRKTGFYEAAHSAGVSNLKLAYLVAVQDDLFTRSGVPDFDALRRGYPELFGATAARPTTPPGHAGSGTTSQPPARSMNDFIRSSSGRK
jgi:hypothetical protein